MVKSFPGRRASSRRRRATVGASITDETKGHAPPMHLVAPALEVTALPPLALPKKRVEIGAFSDQLTGAAVIAGDPIGRTNRNEEKRAKKRQVWYRY